MTIYQHLGIAVAFSPRLQAILAEVGRRASYLAQRMSLIHVGAYSLDKEMRLRELADVAGLPEDVGIYWEEGSPNSVLVNTIKKYDIDFLVAGALERESPMRYLLGSVARDLVREAPCSLLLYTEPHTEPQPIQRMVVVTDYSEGALITLRKAIRFAEYEATEQIFVVRALSSHGDAMALSDGVRRDRVSSYHMATIAEEEALLRDFIDAAGYTKVPIEPHCIEGHTGYITAQFVRDHGADLLVMPSSNRYSHFFERLFPSDMEWVLREIPCNLWVEREAT